MELESSVDLSWREWVWGEGGWRRDDGGGWETRRRRESGRECGKRGGDRRLFVTIAGFGGVIFWPAEKELVPLAHPCTPWSGRRLGASGSVLGLSKGRSVRRDAARADAQTKTVLSLVVETQKRDVGCSGRFAWRGWGFSDVEVDDERSRGGRERSCEGLLGWSWDCAWDNSESTGMYARDRTSGRRRRGGGLRRDALASGRERRRTARPTEGRILGRQEGAFPSWMFWARESVGPVGRFGDSEGRVTWVDLLGAGARGGCASWRGLSVEECWRRESSATRAFARRFWKGAR